jgi:hypothetical protein
MRKPANDANTGSLVLTVPRGHSCRASHADYRRRMARARRKEPTEPATLSIPRQNVKATLAVSCPKCQHKAFIEVDQWPDDMPVALFGSIMECSNG